jgi:hypothetical protein
MERIWNGWREAYSIDGRVLGLFLFSTAVEKEAATAGAAAMIDT